MGKKTKKFPRKLKSWKPDFTSPDWQETIYYSALHEVVGLLIEKYNLDIEDPDTEEAVKMVQEVAFINNEPSCLQRILKDGWQGSHIIDSNLAEELYKATKIPISVWEKRSWRSKVVDLVRHFQK